MIQTSLFYPNTPGARFDYAYYLEKHLPMVKARLDAAVKKMSVDKGIVGGAPGSPAPYLVTARMTFESIQAFEQAFAPHAQEIFGDLPNFTDLQPVMMISEVIID